jgi:hypothetical protein
MAIAFGNKADLGDNGGTSASLTTAYNNASAGRRTILNIIGDYSGGGGFNDISSVTYAGVALSGVAAIANQSGTPAISARYSYIYTGYDLPTGTNNFVITCANTHYILAVVADYTGSAPGTLLDNSTTNLATAPTATVTTLTTSLTTVANNCWLGLSYSPDDSTATVTPTGVTLRQQGAAFGLPNLFDSNGAKTPAGSYSVTTAVSPNVSEIDHILVSFAPLLALPYNPWPQWAPILAQ